MTRHVFVDSSSMISEVNSATDLYMIDSNRSNRLIPRSSSTSDLFEIPAFDKGIPHQRSKRRSTIFWRPQVPVKNYTSSFQTMESRSRSNPCPFPNRNSASIPLPYNTNPKLQRSNTVSMLRNSSPYRGHLSTASGRPTTPSSLRQSFTYNHDSTDSADYDSGSTKNINKLAGEISVRRPSELESKSDFGDLKSSRAPLLLRKPKGQGAQNATKMMSRAEFMSKRNSMPPILPSEEPAFVDALEYQSEVGAGSSRSIRRQLPLQCQQEKQEKQEKQKHKQQRPPWPATGVSVSLHNRAQVFRGNNIQNYTRNYSSNNRVPRYNSISFPKGHGTLVTIDETALLKSPTTMCNRRPVTSPQTVGATNQGRYSVPADINGSRRILPPSSSSFSLDLPSLSLPLSLSSTVSNSQSSPSVTPPTPPVVFGQTTKQVALLPPTIFTPFQLQRQKMKSAFDFPNGEHFTPRDQFYKTERTTTKSSNEKSFSSKQGSSLASHTTKSEDGEIDKKRPRRFAHFFKKLTPSASKFNAHHSHNTSTAANKLPEEASQGQGLENGFFERLQKDWEKVHLNNSPHHSSNTSSPVSSSLSSRSETSMNSFNETSFSSVTSSSNSENMAKKSVKFATEIYVNETFSSDEYERCVDPWRMNSKMTKFVGGDTSLEIKLEVNNFKKFEMDVHSDSMNFTHFFV